MRNSHVVEVMQWTSKNCTKKCDARAALLFFLIGAFYVEGGRSQHQKDPRKQNNFRLSLQAEISSSIVIVFQLIRTYIVYSFLSAGKILFLGTEEDLPSASVKPQPFPCQLNIENIQR